jgi:hypothetical protein
MESSHLRMDKYYEISEKEDKLGKKEMPSRLKRNQDLYRKVSTLDIEDFDINSNISVLGDNTKNIDIGKVQDALKEKYHENPRNKSFGDTDEINLPPIKLDETREYDINVIIEKAKEAHEVDYEEERLKKARSTDEILEGLESIEKKEKDIEDSLGIKADDKEEINTLIDTINAKELIENEGTMEVTGDMDPLDLLSDLKGDDDNTKVLGALVDEVTAELPEAEDNTLDDSDTLSKADLAKIGEEIADTEEIDYNDIEETDNLSTEEIDKAFADTVTEPIGNKKVMSQSDFEDFEDLKEDMEFTKVIIKILVALVVIVFIAALVVLANKYLNLGLF